MHIDDHGRLSEAVRRAEGDTSGEIVTIIADRSDAYHDVGLHYAILAMLLVPILFAVFPHWPDAILRLVTSGWGEREMPALYVLIFFLMALVFLIVRYTLAIMPLRLALTPKATRRRRVRRKAISCSGLAPKNAQQGARAFLSTYRWANIWPKLLPTKQFMPACPTPIGATRWRQ